MFIFLHRYAIGSWERPQLHAPIGWLDALANDVQASYDNSTGPSMRYCTIKAYHCQHYKLISNK